MAFLTNAKRLTEKDLEQVNGGAVVYAGFCQQPGTWEVIDDKTGNVLTRIEDSSLASGHNMAIHVAQDLGQSTQQIAWTGLIQQRNQNSNTQYSMVE